MNQQRITLSLFLLLGLFLITTARAADVVPNEVQMPGTQPNEVGNFESPDKCDNCHAGYDNLAPENEPATGWRGAAMGNAGRDPIFWATLGIVEQDFDGAGDLCIRCHSAGGWYGGRSTPTDGSGLAASDDNGIDCDTCHAMTNPDNSEHLGVMNAPFIANDGENPAEGYYGSGITSLWDGSDKLGPYSDAEARHQFMQSKFHRSVDFCGSCHDVSNPVVGDLAPNNGTQDGAPAVVSSGGHLGGPIEAKAAFNNPPYAYGIVERTYSEYKASAFPTTLVSAFNTLPDDLQTDPTTDDFNGSIETTYKAALGAGTGGNYEDGDPRYFSCQSCHMRPVEAKGCNKRGAPLRKDMPMHDQTGGNYWFANMTQYQDAQGTLRMGGGLTGNQILAMDLGQQRAVNHLQQAADLSVNGNTLKVTNLTGHKLITGYPEGRRMWLNIKWYDGAGTLMREDGAYGPLEDGQGNPVMINNPSGGEVQVESIMDLNDPNTKIYEAHYSMTKEWAQTLISVDSNHYGPIVLSYDRETGTAGPTIADLANGNNAYHETFHFALNNYVSKDNRIPPYGMGYDEAQKRNALPVPADQYGNPGAGGTYKYWDEIVLNPPAGATSATIDLLYQGTSWEYIQFLDKANNGQNAFLGQEGVNMLDAWVNAEVPVAMEVGGDRKMVPPVVMASTTWGAPQTGNASPECSINTPAGDVTINAGDSVNYTGTATDSDGTIASYSWTFEGGNPASSNAEGPGDVSYITAGSYATSFTATDNDGASCTSAYVQVTVNAVGGGDTAGVNNEDIETGLISGKGKNQSFTPAIVFTAGEEITIRTTVSDSNGNPVPDAIVTIDITGPDTASVSSDPSGTNGIAQARWKTSNKGKNPTPTGSYAATVTGVSANGYNWDGVNTVTNFEVQ